MLNSLPFSFPPFVPGTVWLVGAGPGDPGLLTLNALHALGQADVVVYDALVDSRILELARAGAEKIYAGKRGGVASPKQQEISDRLVTLARENKRVLRLKGGDPFVFGRGAEEALTLAEAGVSFRLVPGITAGVGGLAYAGIPTTARVANSAVTFVTGHGASGDVPGNVDWDALAKASPVIVAYMPVKHLSEITQRLIDGGRSPDEPAALISKATTDDQRELIATLGTIAARSVEEKIEAPALFVVGEVVRLHDRLNWRAAPGDS